LTSLNQSFQGTQLVEFFLGFYVCILAAVVVVFFVSCSALSFTKSFCRVESATTTTQEPLATTAAKGKEQQQQPQQQQRLVVQGGVRKVGRGSGGRRRATMTTPATMQ